MNNVRVHAGFAISAHTAMGAHTVQTKHSTFPDHKAVFKRRGTCCPQRLSAVVLYGEGLARKRLEGSPAGITIRERGQSKMEPSPVE